MRARMYNLDVPITLRATALLFKPLILSDCIFVCMCACTLVKNVFCVCSMGCVMLVSPLQYIALHTLKSSDPVFCVCCGVYFYVHIVMLSIMYTAPVLNTQV